MNIIKSYQPDPEKKYFLGFGLSICAESIEYYGYQDHFSNPLADAFVTLNETIVASDTDASALSALYVGE